MAGTLKQLVKGKSQTPQQNLAGDKHKTYTSEQPIVVDQQDQDQVTRRHRWNPGPQAGTKRQGEKKKTLQSNKANYSYTAVNATHETAIYSLQRMGNPNIIKSHGTLSSSSIR